MTQLLQRLKNLARRVKYAQVVDRRFLYELWEQNHLRRLLAELQADCVFDVGANNGQYAQMLRRHADFRGLIVSFEPIPEAAAALRDQASRDPAWVVEELALSDSAGEQRFHIMADPQFSSLSAPRHDDIAGFEGYNRVQRELAVRTDTLVAAHARLQARHGFARPFLKMDTQGMDVRIARAAGREALRPFVGLQSELAVRKLYEHSVDFREALAVYEGLGFELSAFVPNNVGHFPRLVEIDCVMVRADLMPARARVR